MTKKPAKKVPAKKKATAILDEDGQPKLNAAGNRRGMHRSKNRATELLEMMQDMASKKFGVENFDPVVALVQLGLENSSDHVKIDYKGDIEYELDDDGHPKRHPVTGEPIPIIVAADHNIAQTCFGKAAPYVRSTLKQIEISDKDDGPIDADVVDAKTRLAQMAGLDELEDEDGTDT